MQQYECWWFWVHKMTAPHSPWAASNPVPHHFTPARFLDFFYLQRALSKVLPSQAGDLLDTRLQWLFLSKSLQSCGRGLYKAENSGLGVIFCHMQESQVDPLHHMVPKQCWVWARNPQTKYQIQIVVSATNEREHTEMDRGCLGGGDATSKVRGWAGKSSSARMTERQGQERRMESNTSQCDFEVMQRLGPHRFSYSSLTSPAMFMEKRACSWQYLANRPEYFNARTWGHGAVQARWWREHQGHMPDAWSSVGWYTYGAGYMQSKQPYTWIPRDTQLGQSTQ